MCITRLRLLKKNWKEKERAGTQMGLPPSVMEFSIAPPRCELYASTVSYSCIRIYMRKDWIQSTRAQYD